jgi:transposase
MVMKKDNTVALSPVSYLTPDVLAKRLGVSEKTLASWRTRVTETGESYGPRFIKLPRRVLYPVSEVEAWEKRKLQTSTAG